MHEAVTAAGGQRSDYDAAICRTREVIAAHRAADACEVTDDTADGSGAQSFEVAVDRFVEVAREQARAFRKRLEAAIAPLAEALEVEERFSCADIDGVAGLMKALSRLMTALCDMRLRQYERLRQWSRQHPDRAGRYVSAIRRYERFVQQEADGLTDILDLLGIVLTLKSPDHAM